MKLSDYVTDFLIDKGITHGFGYPGGSVTNFLDSIYKRTGEIQCHVVYHEQAAAFAACGYANVTGKPGLCYATGGPGCTNLLTGIGHAMYDSIPLIAITGNSNTYERKGDLPIRQRGFQENDNVAVMKSLTKYSVCIDRPENIRYELEKSYYYAMSGRRGPVHIDLPMDVQRAQIEPSELKGFCPDTETGSSYNEQKNITGKIEELLLRSKRPCFILGNGIKTAQLKREAGELIKKFGIPYVTSMIAFDVLGSSEYNYGFLGAYGDRAANFVLAKSDLVISLGSRLDIRQVGARRENFAPNATIVRFDIDDGELEYCVHRDEISVCMELCDAITLLNKVQVKPDYDQWIGVCNTICEKLAGFDEKLPNTYIREISEYIPENAIISTDVGQNQVWVAQSFQLKDGQEVSFSGGMGSMGHALPAILGASYSGRKRPLVCICGDGGMQMNIQELQYIAREKIPVKMIVMNNHALGMIRHFQEMYFDRVYYQTTLQGGYTTPDFVKVAEAYGIRGMAVNTLEDLKKTEELLKDDSACLIEIRIEEETYVVPKLEFGKPNQDQEPLIDRALYKELMEM